MRIHYKSCRTLSAKNWFAFSNKKRLGKVQPSSGLTQAFLLIMMFDIYFTLIRAFAGPGKEGKMAEEYNFYPK